MPTNFTAVRPRDRQLPRRSKLDMHMVVLLRVGTFQAAHTSAGAALSISGNHDFFSTAKCCINDLLDL
jgi:hypothetical protein